jgi:hypothetical protein
LQPSFSDEGTANSSKFIWQRVHKNDNILVDIHNLLDNNAVVIRLWGIRSFQQTRGVSHCGKEFICSETKKQNKKIDERFMDKTYTESEFVHLHSELGVHAPSKPRHKLAANEAAFLLSINSRKFVSN